MLTWRNLCKRLPVMKLYDWATLDEMEKLIPLFPEGVNPYPDGSAYDRLRVLYDWVEECFDEGIITLAEFEKFTYAFNRAI